VRTNPRRDSETKWPGRERTNVETCCDPGVAPTAGTILACANNVFSFRMTSDRLPRTVRVNQRRLLEIDQCLRTPGIRMSHSPADESNP
jgi:hypothetical protein